ncbi:MAG TPA: hypothetical protein VGH64_11330 [Puia sp.]
MLDSEFLSVLSSAGIFDAARRIGLDANKYLVPLAFTNHSYRRYRWSVGYHQNGGLLINAYPPEEEAGWAPWERWYEDEGITRKDAWVLYPLKDPAPSGNARWYRLKDDDLFPWHFRKDYDLESVFRRARIAEAANIIGFDADEILIKPLSKKGKLYYEQCRWAVIPHFLGDDGPVIYILPPMNRSDDWPWESWYTDGRTKLIHHVHFTQKKKNTKGTWREYPGAPQRPPEIFGVEWHWYDDKNLIPTMCNL